MRISLSIEMGDEPVLKKALCFVFGHRFDRATHMQSGAAIFGAHRLDVTHGQMCRRCALFKKEESKP